ncbi:hypothetical protein [Pseudomonas massiliensis]|uniref:hypothetical protein n=1 Tax=Pseudomonas massiliensis TaxID=522492 RepID=UPI0006944E96|nr:hypothetical protein [Pseudomonas massiliensis]
MPRRNRPEVIDRDRLESPLTALEPLSPHRRSPSRMSPALWIGGLTVVVALGVSWAHLKAYWQPESSTLAEAALPAQPVTRPALPISAPATALASAPARAQARPLADCLAGSTVINEEVLRCRFGNVPPPRMETQPRQGLVSAAYLKQYRAERAARPVSDRREHVNGTETQVIPGWDGHGSYLATWQVVDNEVDTSSVCRNHRQGSIDYRECRKGAKQWFMQQCRSTQSSGGSGDSEKRRYCSAASFSPMG